MAQKQQLMLSPDLPWKVRLLLFINSFAVNNSLNSNGTVNRTFLNLFDLKSSPSKNPINGVKSFDITVDPSRELWFRLYTPTTTTTTATSLPIIINFHGDGFILMAANSKPFDKFCRRLAREIPSSIVSAVNYRLAPEHKYPCQYEDGFDVLKFIDEENLEHFPQNANLKQSFLAGDSAGGNIAHHVALKASESKASESKFLKLQVIGLTALQPFFGGEERTVSENKLDRAPVIKVEHTEWFWKAFLPEGSNRDHATANVFGPNSVDISRVNFPATIVFVGGFYPVQDWQKKYYEGLHKAGKEANLIEYENAFHSFYAFPELPEYSLMIKEISYLEITKHSEEKQQMRLILICVKDTRCNIENRYYLEKHVMHKMLINLAIPILVQNPQNCKHSKAYKATSVLLLGLPTDDSA
ncbi:hypothetical protein SO802_024895 [Lithocarpus litseifolius]|uniref:Alpha/beta hydrolase fold-3 domain-containing protein n=1 Tax=Lithocarpus litseifolius TaxID=425828 RepID=A0AAW2CD21_9ROSI